MAARLPAPRRRRQLLDVARQVFAESGFHPTSMNDIAEAAGVTKPVLYQHFGSKRELYLELLDDVGGQLADPIGKATVGGARARGSRSRPASAPTSASSPSTRTASGPLRWRDPPRRGVQRAGPPGRGVDRRGHRRADRCARASTTESRRLLAHGSSVWPRAPAATGSPADCKATPTPTPSSWPTWRGPAFGGSPLGDRRIRPVIEVPAGSFYLGEKVGPDHARTGEPVLVDSDDLTTHGVDRRHDGFGQDRARHGPHRGGPAAGNPGAGHRPEGRSGQPAARLPRPGAGRLRTVGRGRRCRPRWRQDWREGLAGWGIDGARIRALQDAATATIYTPGSTAGTPLNIVGSLSAPADPSDVETVRDEVEGFVSGLLDHGRHPGRPAVEPRAHPPVEPDRARLGVGSEPRPGRPGRPGAATAGPQARRVRHRHVLPSGRPHRPGHAAQRSAGVALVRGVGGRAAARHRHAPCRDGEKPRAAIVSVAHLSDDERQFVVTAVLSKLTTWMRRQPGTDRLRAARVLRRGHGLRPPAGEPAGQDSRSSRS